MKMTHTLLTLAAASALIGLPALAADTTGTTTETPPPPPTRRHGERPPHSPEMKAWHEKALQIYDADKSGKLDPDERQLLREDVHAGKFEAPPRMEAPGGPGHRGLPPAIREKYDANKDGKLDETERAALRADVDAGKVELPPRHQTGEGRKGHRGPPPPPPPEDDVAEEAPPAQ